MTFGLWVLFLEFEGRVYLGVAATLDRIRGSGGVASTAAAESQGHLITTQEGGGGGKREK